MALVDMRDMLRHAYENKYAVGAFNVINMNMLQGVIGAAERARAPVIIGLSEPHLDHFRMDQFAPAVEATACQSSVPVAIHFDHGRSLDSAAQAIRFGCNSLMIDASHEDLQTNVDLTKAVVQMARTCDIPVEAELGYVPETGGEELVYTTVAEASGFVRITDVDFLAVSIGTVHGHMTGKAKLDFPRLRQINEALNMPLVLHGSSGLTDDQFHKLVANGIAKVNYFTALTDQAALLLRANAKDKNHDYLELFAGIRQVIEDEADRLMRVLGSAGRAAEVLARCRPRRLVDHIIKFNLPDCDPSEAALIIGRGRDILLGLPGVRDVITSESLDDEPQHRHRWIVRVTSPSVIEHLGRYTDFNVFMNRYVTPRATDLVRKTFLQDRVETGLTGL